MGIRLVAEVLDHYHGRDSRKLWMLAFAEKANDRTRQGWPGRQLLAHRTGRSPTRVSHIAGELISEGTIKRIDGDWHRHEVHYELLPLAAANDSKSAAKAHPEDAARAHPQPEVDGAESARQGAQLTPQGAPISPLPAETPHNPHNPHKPSSRARVRGIIRAAYPDATDDEIDKITQDKISHGARSAEAVLSHEARAGTLALPCDRDGPGRHSNACRDGNSGGCTVSWCACRCHTEPRREDR
jgi:hypothetical protein